MLKDHGEDPKPSHWAAMSYYLQVSLLLCVKPLQAVTYGFQ